MALVSASPSQHESRQRSLGSAPRTIEAGVTAPHLRIDDVGGFKQVHARSIRRSLIIEHVAKSEHEAISPNVRGMARRLRS